MQLLRFVCAIAPFIPVHVMRVLLQCRKIAVLVLSHKGLSDVVASCSVLDSWEHECMQLQT